MPGNCTATVDTTTNTISAQSPLYCLFRYLRVKPSRPLPHNHYYSALTPLSRVYETTTIPRSSLQARLPVETTLPITQSTLTR